MQIDKSVYTDLVYLNTNVLDTNGIAVSSNLAKANSLSLGDKLYSKHIVNGEICEYTIEQIIPETVCVRTNKSKMDSNGIIIMGYDAKYVDNITHSCIVFTDKSIDELVIKCSDTPQNIIYRDDEISTAMLNIFPCLGVFLLVAIIISCILACILTNGIACNFRRLIMLGFEKKKLNQIYYSYIYMTCVSAIIISLALSIIVFLFVGITAIRIISAMWIPFIELITLFIFTSVSNKQLWRG